LSAAGEVEQRTSLALELVEPPEVELAPLVAPAVLVVPLELVPLVAPVLRKSQALELVAPPESVVLVVLVALVAPLELVPLVVLVVPALRR